MNTRGRLSKPIRIILDSINIIASVAVVFFTIYVFVDTTNHKPFFALVFLLGAVVNLATSVKYLATGRKAGGFVMLGIAAILVGLALWCHAVTGGL